MVSFNKMHETLKTYQTSLARLWSAYGSFQVPMSRIVIKSNRCRNILTVTVSLPHLKGDRGAAAVIST